MGPDTLAGPRRTMASMTEQTAEQAGPSANGTAPNAAVPGPEAGPCEDCVSGGEKAVALVAALFGAFIIVMAIDMMTGGAISGRIAERAERE